MPTTFTKAQASKLLNATEMKLFEESRINALRAFSASQLDRRVERSRALRDKARDQLQRQRLAQRERTGSKRGTSGSDNQQRSKDKAALIADILKRFEGQLKVARRNEKAGIVPKAATKRRVTRKAAVSRTRSPGKDNTASRMRTRNRTGEEAASTMKSRAAGATTAKAAKKTAKTTKKVAKKAAARKTSTVTKAPARKTAARKSSAPSKRAKKSAAKTTQPFDAGSETRGKRTASIRDLNDADQGGLHGGFANDRARNVAQQKKLEAGRLTAIQSHLSSRVRRDQGRRDRG